MHAQFEKHDIIRDNKIIYDKGKWKEAYQQIVDNIQERTRMKESKLHEMLRWIHEENCLREAYINHFNRHLRSQKITAVAIVVLQ